MGEEKQKCCGNCYCCAMEKETGRLICMNADSRRCGNRVNATDDCSYYEPKDDFAVRKNGIH